MTKIIFLGGDERMLYAKERLEKKYNISVSFEKSGISFNYAVLPLQKGPDGETIFGTDIKYSSLPRFISENGTVLTGHNCPGLIKVCEKNGFTLINYAEREDFAVANAVPTAEGALAIAINSRKETLFGSDVLITGYGRIAKILSAYIKALGGRVWVACRKKSDLKWAEINGYRPINITDKKVFAEALSRSDIVFNTVPYPVFGEEEIKSIKKGAVYIELASSDGLSGESKDFFTVITARGLPGKTAPVTAGNIIADTIASIIAERSDTYDI